MPFLNTNTTQRDWNKFRSDLIDVAREGDHDWMEDDDFRSILREASRTGMKPRLLISCQAAIETPHPERSVNSHGGKTRVLVIDDEHNNCEMLKIGLEKSGFEVQTEEKSPNFRAAIDAFHPDLLLLDMVMPDMDGVDILERLDSDAALRSLPVIVLTGLLRDSDAESVNREGLLFLAKPLGTRTLVHCINQHLAH